MIDESATIRLVQITIEANALYLWLPLNLQDRSTKQKRSQKRNTMCEQQMLVFREAI